MLDEDMTRAMSAEPPELPPRLDYTQCPTHGNTELVCNHLCNLPEVKGSFRPEEKKARSIKNMALYQQTGNQRLQSQLHLSHIPPQLAWVGVPVPMAEPSYAPLHVVTPSTTTLAAAVVRSIQSS